MDVTVQFTPEETQDILSYAYEHDLPGQMSLGDWIKGLITERLAS